MNQKISKPPPAQRAKGSYSDPVGPGSYDEVGREIIERGHSVPIASRVPRLFESIFRGELGNLQEFNAQLRNRYFLVYTPSVLTSKGVYFIDDPNADFFHESTDEDSLEARMHKAEEINGIRVSKDGLTRFAPSSSYKSGKTSPEKLVSNGLIFACYWGVATHWRIFVEAQHLTPYVVGANIKEGGPLVRRYSGINLTMDPRTSSRNIIFSSALTESDEGFSFPLD